MQWMSRLWREYKSVAAFLVLMVVFRSTVVDWNVVPSASMLPTILPGDHIIVDKMAYELRVPLTHISAIDFHGPRRGDIVTIDSSAVHELLVKRVIGLPGDRISMNHNVLYVNGRRAAYQPLGSDLLTGDSGSPAEYQLEHADGIAHRIRLSVDTPSPRSSFDPLVVPAHEYFMLGDNRDNSADSRYFGFFPRSEIMGRVRRVAFSLDPDHFYLPRIDRFATRLDHLPAQI